MDKLKSTGMILTGALATSAIDSSGEVLDIDGADISLLQEKKGFVNIEHIMPDGDDQESTPVEAEEGEKLVGKIIFARKIKSLEDCQDEDQRRWWKVYKLPMIYGAVRLFDGAGHKNAQAIAAVIRDHIANNEPLEVGFSVEGATLKRDGYKLKETIIRGVALTVKPCNKSATADLVYDPKAPEGYQVLPQGKAIFKSEDAIYTKLGGARGIVSPDLLKAMSAGSYNSAPGTLTGGAALQVEDKNLRATAKAAVRDWPKTGPFKVFLKSYLEKNNIGDASDEFLNHYSDLVESKYWRIKKSQEVLNDLKKKGKEVAAKKPAAATGFTNNGAPVKPNPKLAGAKFDEKSGTLHIPEGSFKVYIPSRDPDKNVGDAFHGIMQDPKVEQFHGYAMENWAKAHKLLKAGKLPPEVAMHSVLFSQLSPNTPVPMQEMMYGHLVDQMGHSGKDALHPDFASNRNDWLNRDQPEKFPDHSPEHWKRLEDSLRIKTDSKTTGRPAGSIGSFMLANNKFDNMEQYHKMHGPLMEMLANSKGDVRSVADQMMHQKNEQVKWNNRRRIALGAGKPDPGEYPGMSIAGLAPKTTRYALAMMGGGNVHVPDTHFVRNLFGLNRDLDSKSIQAIKNHLWNEKNSHVLNGIDRYYANNHDAVRHMLQHPTWGKVFEKPEDAIFPAFWKHWMGIVPHEKARGHTINGYNELTDHKPYWEAIAPFMKNDSNHSLPMQTARQHAEWQLQYGEIPAQMLYFRYLLPKLLGPAAQRESQTIIRKAQELQVERLAKQDQNSASLAHGVGRAVQQVQPFSQASNKENWMQMMDNVASAAGVPNIADKNKLAIDKGHIVNFQGRKYKPGSAIDIDKGDGYTLLGHDATHFYAVPDKIDITRGWTDKDLKKLPRHSENLEVYHYPESVDEPLTVDIGRHGVAGMNERPESQALAHGFVFGGPKKLGGGATGNAGDSYWSKTPDGKNVFVKKASTVFNNHTEAPDNTARREGIYANLAHGFFGLGQHLPNVAVVKHPQTGQEHALIEHVPGTHTHSHSDSEVKQALKNVNKNGDLHKIAMMNYIMGNSDRHSGNFMLTSSNPDLGPDGIKLIDHNIFGSKRVNQTPSYLAYMNDDSTGEGNDIMHKMHPEAEKWLMSLDPAELRQQLMANHMPQYSIDRSVQRLQRMRNYASVAPNLWEVLQYSDAPDEAPERGSYNPVWSSDVKDSDDSR